VISYGLKGLGRMIQVPLSQIAKRLLWDILDPSERAHLLYFFIAGIPGLFGDLLRGRFISRRVAYCGRNLMVLSGTRFRSIDNLRIGDNVCIGHDNFIQALGGVSIGNDVMTAPGVKIWSVNHNYKKKSALICEQGQTANPVVIGNDVWISSNAFISPGVKLPDGVVVSAGAVVGVKNYLPYSIIAGNPARVIGYREVGRISENGEQGSAMPIDYTDG
jgi:acetyltransferase-like isoleucine patch superfamily enzyme